MSFEFFAACAPGIEPWLGAELGALGIERPREEPGGVGFVGSAADMAAVCLRSGLANHLRVRVDAPFAARRFDQLQRKAARQPWTRLLPANARVAVRATCRKSRLYHSTAVSERVAAVIAEAIGDPEPEAPEIEVLVRIVRDRCTLSVDVSGPALHRRGWRQQTAKAPLREDLARALLVVSGWTPQTALVDPMMGSGTLVIEAATMARNMAPGRGRRFAFEDTPLLADSGIEAQRARAESEIHDAVAAPLMGLDQNSGALRAAQGNAERAGVLDAVQLEQQELSDGAWPSRPTVVCNPPYGVRVAPGKPLRALYARLGARVRDAEAALAIIIANPRLASATAVPLSPRLRTSHGGIDITMMTAPTP